MLLALTRDWWVEYSGSDPLRSHFLRIDAETVLPIVQNALKRKGITVDLLAARMGVHHTTLWRGLNAQTVQSLYFLRGLASILDLGLGDFFPDENMRIYKAALRLYRGNTDITLSEAKACVEYKKLHEDNPRGVIDRVFLRKVLEAVPELENEHRAEISILRVAEGLELPLMDAHLNKYGSGKS